MSRLLTTLLVLLLLFVFVLPNPVAAGTMTGNAIQSVAVFLKSAANEVSNTVATPGAAGGTGLYPTGGVASGDGTAYRAEDTPLLDLGSVPVTTSALAPPLAHSPPVRLRIPSIGVTSGIVDLGLEFDGTMQVPQTAQIVGWYRDGPTPGERGPAVATAHVDWRHEKGVFHDLGKLRPGNEVTVDRADGAAVVFQVTRVAEYHKTQFPTHEVYGATAGPELRLITCGGRYDVFTRSYDDNIVVFARMVLSG